MTRLSPLQFDPLSGLGFRMLEPAPAPPRSLLVLLHGVGGSETNLTELAAMVPVDTLVLLARGPLIFGPEQYAWFRVTFTPAGPLIVATEAEESRQALILLIESQQQLHGIPPECTVVGGFSQGGILSASVGLTAPEQVAGFAILAGRILPELQPIIAKQNRLTQLQAFIAHGSDDDKLPVSWAQRAHQWLEQLGVSHDLKLYPGGHVISADMANDFVTWVSGLSSLSRLKANQDRLELHLDTDAVSLSGGSLVNQKIRVAPGIDEVASTCLASHRSLAYAMEVAIARIEDDLASVPKSVYRAQVFSRSHMLQIIAQACGLDSDQPISRDAVEQLLNRQAAVASGRPSASEALPEGLSFVAALLLLRELMHHLDIEAIQHN